jgi:hypothetical protein
MDLAVVNSRKLLSNVLTLAPSGWTYGRTFVLYDYETESMWLPMENEKNQTEMVCISGQYADQKLPEIESVMTTWNLWKRDNPDTKIMK